MKFKIVYSLRSCYRVVAQTKVARPSTKSDIGIGKQTKQYYVGVR